MKALASGWLLGYRYGNPHGDFERAKVNEEEFAGIALMNHLDEILETKLITDEWQLGVLSFKSRLLRLASHGCSLIL